MTYDFADFGEIAPHVRLFDAQAEAEARAIEQAKAILLAKLATTTCDHEGKHLNERNWEWVRDLVESL